MWRRWFQGKNRVEERERGHSAVGTRRRWRDRGAASLSPRDCPPASRLARRTEGGPRLTLARRPEASVTPRRVLGPAAQGFVEELAGRDRDALGTAGRAQKIRDVGMNHPGRRACGTERPFFHRPSIWSLLLQGRWDPPPEQSVPQGSHLKGLSCGRWRVVMRTSQPAGKGQLPVTDPGP